MKKEECFENYPAWIVFLANIVSLAIYLIGALIIYKLGLVWLILYLVYILILEFKLIGGHCRDCYYYGKTCAFGKGRVSAMFFKRGNLKNFCKMKLGWKNLIPDFLISLVPVIVGIILLIINFDWCLLLLVVVLIILASIGTSSVRSKLACKYCKQRQLGCPAQKLFEKRKR